MKKTELLELPIYDTPDIDVFDLQDWNVANQNLENTIASIVGGDNVVNIVNQEVVDARKGKTTLLEKINEMDLKDESNIKLINDVKTVAETNKTDITTVKGDITQITSKVTNLEGLKNNGGAINGVLEINEALIIKDDTQLESRLKLKSSSGNLRVVKYDIQTPQLEDEMFSVTYGRDGGSKTLNFGSSLKDNNGYTQLPNGMMLQWGVFNSTLESRFKNISMNFPVSFNGGVKVFINCDWLSGTSSTANMQCNASSLTNSGFIATFKADDSTFAASGFSAEYFAIGY